MSSSAGLVFTMVLALPGATPAAVALAGATPAAAAPARQAPTAVPAPVPTAAAPQPRAAPPVNLLKNPGFEEGTVGWTHMGGSNWGAFDVVGAPVRSGSKAALLPVLGAPGTGPAGSKVFGVVQEIRLDEMPGGFPETLSGWYRVERWSKADPATFMYLQAVVIVWGDPRAGKLVPEAPGITNYQIRFLLAGTERQPFALTNARFDFISRDQPKVGEWVRFEIPVRRRFQEMWGVVPDGFQFLRVLFEARWDSRPAGSGVDTAVAYDDLFFGYGKPQPATVPAAGPGRSDTAVPTRP